MSAPRGTWRGLVAVALVAAACSDSTGPQPELSNPQQLSSDLQSVASVFTAPVFQSFGALGTMTGSPLPARSPAGALLGAAAITPPRTSQPAYANAPRQLLALRAAAAALGSDIYASVIPPALLGTTFTWDVGTHQYVQDASFTPAAPADRVRIILYAVDPFTGDVVETPLTPMGFVDLVEASSANTNALQVILRGGTPSSPGTTYADYTVSGTVTGNPATGFDASASGFVTDGTHTLTFNATLTATNLDTDPDVDVQVTWDLDNPAVHVVLDQTLTTNANEFTLTIHNFSVQHGDQTVSVTGSVTVVLVPQTITVNLTIFVDGSQYATITGTNDGIQFRRRDGRSPSQAELAALASLFELPDQLVEAISDLFHPCESLMGA
ncbi:MAG TPA: hypothetical protein VFU41_01265 [Gemmatimonadales bacterium]|nr:hypothetical protein [Gemmatimonadales bacterium]